MLLDYVNLLSSDQCSKLLCDRESLTPDRLNLILQHLKTITTSEPYNEIINKCLWHLCDSHAGPEPLISLLFKSGLKITPDEVEDLMDEGRATHIPILSLFIDNGYGVTMEQLMTYRGELERQCCELPPNYWALEQKVSYFNHV